MIFGSIILVLFAVVVYFHYVQGLFSATLSAIMAVLAAVLALSYYESVVLLLLKGSAAESAGGIVLVALFVLIYLVLRVAFDSLVPGNVRFSMWVDRIGAGTMGAVAAAFATGTLAIAAQMLPFGPSIAGHTRYATRDRENVYVAGRDDFHGGKEGTVESEMTTDTFEPDSVKRLLLPVDDLVVGTTHHLSDGGSLAGSVPFAQVHPDLLQELFGSRLGIQTGGKQVALNVPSARRSDVKVQAAYWRSSLTATDAELTQIRERTVPATLKPESSQVLLVLRTMFSASSTADKDRKTRFSPGAVRLVGEREEDGRKQWRNYYPIGTLDETGTKLYANRVDDFLILDGQEGVDLAFLVDREDVVAASQNQKSMPIKPGVFLEAKRWARVDLSGLQVTAERPEGKNLGVVIKPIVAAKFQPKRPGGPGGPGGPPPGAGGPPPGAGGPPPGAGGPPPGFQPPGPPPQ